MLRRMHPRAFVLLASLAAATTFAGCGADEPASGATAKVTATATSEGLSIVALGDSETTGSGDETGKGWVQRYADLLHERLGVEVTVQNLAVNGKTSDMLVADLRDDEITREAVAGAQVVLFGIGGADLNAGDDRFAAGECKAEECYRPGLKAFERNLADAVAAVKEIRGSNTTVLRSITQPNVLTGAEDVIPPFLKRISTRIGTFQARTANKAICRVMADAGGRCIDVLKAFNGPSGRENAYEKGLLNHEDCCYPSAKGHQLMAELLVETGLAPLR